MKETPVFAFAEFILHPTRRELSRHGVPVELGSRAIDVLLALLRRHGQVAAKSDIMSEVWPGVVVEENNLTTQIAAVRRALGEAEGRRFILTVPGRGYRFVADVVETPPAAASAPAAPPAPALPPPALPSSTSAPPEPAGERHNLRLELSSFIGRENELKEVGAGLRSRALVTILGPGGVGKTRVALKLAAELIDSFPDGVFQLELAPLTESRLVAEAACRLLGVPATGDRPAEDMVVSVLRARKMLLVLDNCEHVLAGAASLTSAILSHCPSMKILATSQEALGIAGEWVFPLPALPVPPANGTLTAAAAMRCDAVRLFAERAADALGSYTLTDADAQSVATICRRLDGVPLATELAAARLRMLKPSEIAARLENVFRLLTGGSRVALPRHQTLRATIDWSFSLLSPSEQIVLRRLSVFVDGSVLEGAVAVASGGPIDADEVFDLLAALVAKSLVVADTTGSATRFRMLETTRQYAAEKLAAAGEQDCCRAMATYLLGVFRRAERDWPTQGTDAWLAAYAHETENLRAAIEWAFAGGDPAIGVALVAHSGAIAEEMSLQADLRRWAAAALPYLTEATPKAEAATVLYLHSAQQKRLGVYEVPAERHRAIALFREAGDVVGLSRALRQTAVARAMPGEAAQEVTGDAGRSRVPAADPRAAQGPGNRAGAHRRRLFPARQPRGVAALQRSGAGDARGARRSQRRAGQQRQSRGTAIPRRRHAWRAALRAAGGGGSARPQRTADIGADPQQHRRLFAAKRRRGGRAPGRDRSAEPEPCNRAGLSGRDVPRAPGFGTRLGGSRGTGRRPARLHQRALRDERTDPRAT
ncbi:MAG: winged helix-turn-helix domain-containing protein [Rhodospirillales bacterium]